MLSRDLAVKIAPEVGSQAFNLLAFNIITVIQT